MIVVPTLSAWNVNTSVPPELPAPLFWAIALALYVGSQLYPVVAVGGVIEKFWPCATTICFPVVAVVDAACDAVLAAWLLLVDDVQPATNKEAITSTRTAIAAGGFDCILLPVKRFIILAIGFTHPPP